MNKFNQIENKSIPQLEDDVNLFWKTHNIFGKSVESKPKDNLYVFYDGPPFISGLPHYGHLLGSIAKDLIPRYWTMQGKRVERVWGWDAHGLTVENKVQKKLGIKNRKDIEQYGLEKFIQECYIYTSETSAEWQWYVDKIARWVDMEHAYRTTDQDYMESVMWVFRQLYDKGLIYEGVRTSLYCTTCGTPVSNFEVAMDNSYRDVEDPSIVVEFPVTSEGKFKGTRILAWTTTPWTVPSNRGLVVDPEELYVLVEADNKRFILAKKRLELLGSTYNVVEEFSGQELVGLDYEPPYSFYASNEKDFKVYGYKDMVSMEEGTGIVHAAPGFGEIDTEMGRKYGLTVMLTIDDEGKFIPGNAGDNPFTGMFYIDANPEIRKDLSGRGLLFKDERIVHRFPYHDRCDTNLIQKAQNSWFVDIQKLKKQLLANNEPINWVPPHIKQGRFKNGIEQAPDWCISRTRFWATPMPIWEAEDGSRIAVSSVKELEELSGQEVKDLHRPYIDNITFEKDGKLYKRREEVLDSWFEAGSMPYGQLHYPFEHVEKFEQNFPGDYIVEYAAQVRAWFYVMHVLSTAVFDKPSFKNVIVTGTIAGSDGRKMSKTYGNYTDPREVLETIGGDALRLYLMNSPLMYAEGANFDLDELKTKSRNVLNPLLNSLKFFLIYAAEYNWDSAQAVVSEHVLDKWITARLHETIKSFKENIESYNVPPAVAAIETFVDDLSRWYVRRSRDRIAGGDNEALSTLYAALLTFAKASAPIIPFMTETLFQHLSDECESVHLCDYPDYDQQVIEQNGVIIKNMADDRNLVSEILSQRTKAGIAVRQPLAKVETSLPFHYEEIIKEETNIKYIVKLEIPEAIVNLDTTIDHALEVEGAAREMIRTFQGLRKKQGLSVGDTVTAYYEDSHLTAEVIAKFGTDIRDKIGAKTLIPSSSYAIKKA